MVCLDDLEAIGHSLGNIHQALRTLSYYYPRLSPELRARKFRDVSTRLSSLARTARGITQSQKPERSRNMLQQDLVYSLIQLANEADGVSQRAATTSELPDPIRAGVLDRIMQLASLLRLLATQINQLDPRAQPLNIDMAA